MIAVDQCPVCSHSGFKILHSCIDTLVSRETFTIQTCESCRLGITSPRPSGQTIGQYYLSDEYISHSGTQHGVTGKLYVIARKFTLKWKHRLIEKYGKQGPILDFGCGTGEFLQTIQKSGWPISGVEPSEAARKKASLLTKGKIHAGIKELDPQEFNVITLWHVLEHVPNLKDVLKQLHRHLRKDGTIFIAVPNYNSPDADHYKEYWAGYDVPRHLWHFTKTSMTSLLQQTGFTMEAIVPMKLDAYYISLLSEKNKGSSSPIKFLNALFWGTLSNLKAAKKINHSSLLYIAKAL